MIIILEGNECNFKTTVAEKLSKSLELPVVKGSSFENAKCTNLQLYKHFVKLASMDDVIIDRSWISNRVYATLYEDYAILTGEQREDIENMVNENTVAVLVYLHADEDILVERLRERGDEYVDESMIDKINDTYTEAIRGTRIHTIHYDTGVFSSDRIAEGLTELYRILKGIYG